jgi:hypothetical protein
MEMMNYNEQRKLLLGYLHAKIDINDWHAVRDVAVDLEILDAREAEKNKHTAMMAAAVVRNYKNDEAVMPLSRKGDGRIGIIEKQIHKQMQSGGVLNTPSHV